MITKIPKNEVVLPLKHKEALKRRRRNRKGSSESIKIEPYEIKLIATKRFWRDFLEKEFELELIPSIYCTLLRSRETEKKIFTNGHTCMAAQYLSDEKKILLLYGRQGKYISREEAEKRGEIWINAPHALVIDKRRHFLKRYFERKFDLTLIVALYRELKKRMPRDRISVSDGIYKLSGHKKTGLLIELNTGIKIGEIDWEDYVDKKL
jgi:hypothetical protein